MGGRVLLSLLLLSWMGTSLRRRHVLLENINSSCSSSL